MSGPGYVFLDEGGNLDFSPTGSRFFTITSVFVQRPFPADEALNKLRFDLIETGLDIEKFHASEDRQAIRDKVFAIIGAHLDRFRVDSVVIEKRKTGPSLRDDARFYPEMMGYLLRYVITGLNMSGLTEVVVITDKLPVQKKRDAVEKTIKSVLTKMLPAATHYRVLHHESRSCTSLQVADYFNWAIFRAWELRDRRSLSIVESAIVSQFDIFRQGSFFWY